MRKTIFTSVFLLVGLSTGLIGPSILYLEKLAGSREDETALVFTSKAVGCIGGWIVSCLLLDSEGSTKPSDLLSVGLFGLVISNGLIIFVKHLWWMLAVFFLQGLFVTISLQGCVYHRESVKHRLHIVPQYLTTVFLLGCVFTPYLLFIEPNLNSITSLVVHPSTKLNEPQHSRNHNFISNISNVNPIKFVESSSTGISKNNKISPVIRMPRQITVSTPPLNESNFDLQTTPQTTMDINHHKISTDQPHNLNIILPNFTLTNEININETPHNITVNSSSAIIKPTTKKKPSVNDAKHLNQDSSSADGSKAASKMKKLTEERQIEKLDDDPSTHKPLTSVVNPNELRNLVVQNQSTTTITNMLMNITNLNSTKQSNNNDTISKISPNSSFSHLSLHLNNVSTGFPHNSTIVKDHKSNEIFINNVNSTKDIDISNASKPITNNKVILGIYNITDEVGLITNNSSTQFTFSKFPSVLQSNDIIVVINSTNRKYHHHRIAEHSLDKSHRNLLLPFQHPVESVQKVYLLLSIISMILWLLTIPLTSWCESIFIRYFGLKIIDDNNFELISTGKLSSPSMMQRSDPDNNENHSEEGLKSRLLGRSDEDDSESDSDELWNRSHFVDNNDELVCHSDSELNDDSVILKNSLIKSSSGNNISGYSMSKSMAVLNPNIVDNNNTSATSSMIDCSVFETHWPRIQWPSNFWLLLSVFLNSGLETTYAGFVASLTIRYLLWSPTLAIIVTSLFWLGNLVGFLVRLLIINKKWPDIQDNLPGISNSQLLSKGIYSTRKHRRNYAKNTKSSIIITSIQLCGCFICIISSIALTYLSMSIGRCSTTSSSSLSQLNINSLSHPYITWLIGSFCFGIGIGLSSSYTDTLMTIHLTTNLFFSNSYSIQLSIYFGQLLIPALVAMLHHQALFWRYSCVHNISVLCLSILMSITFINHFIIVTMENRRNNLLRSTKPNRNNNNNNHNTCLHHSNGKISTS
uniref:Nodulin-like domain-containing protein n=2 Tax=Schistosoma mansoni TaxID=6183 RepID=A0A3Q0KTX9_SCHMA